MHVGVAQLAARLYANHSTNGSLGCGALLGRSVLFTAAAKAQSVEKCTQEPQLLTHIVQVWRDDGLPAGVPLLDTETNAHGGEASVEIFGALWLSDTFAGFLNAGGKGTVYHHALSYSPAHPVCPSSWGTYHMFMVDEKYEIKSRTSQFFAAQHLPQEGAQPVDAEHRISLGQAT